MASSTRVSGRDNLIGCLGLLGFLLSLAAIAVGWPPSLYCLGALAGWGILKVARSELDAADPERRDLKARLLATALAAAGAIALWTAIGTGGVWLLQLALRLGLALDPTAAADLQLRAFDEAAALRSTLNLPIWLCTIGAATLLALLVDRLWPLGALALARKLIGIAAAMLGAFAAFGFVAVGTGADRWVSASEPLRAGIAGDLEALRAARQQGAALAWASALIEAERRRAPSAASEWQLYLAAGERLCLDAQRSYRAGYDAATVSQRLARLCDADAFRDRLVAARLTAAAAPRAGPDPVAWLPDFGVAARPSDPVFEPVGTLDAVSPATRLRDIRLLRARLSARLNDAEKARSAADGALSRAAGEWLGAVSPALAEGIARSVTDALLEIAVREDKRIVAERLRLAGLPLSKAAGALLGLSPVELDSPGSAARRPRPLAADVRAVWDAAFPVPPLPAELAAYGRRQAARADAEDRFQREARRRETDQAQEMMERAAEIRMDEAARR